MMVTFTLLAQSSVLCEHRKPEAAWDDSVAVSIKKPHVEADARSTWNVTVAQYMLFSCFELALKAMKELLRDHLLTVVL